MQLMTFQAFLLQKNYSSTTSEIPQSNGSCTEEECAMQRTSLSNWRRKLMTTEACSPDLSHTRVLADISITALYCLGKDTDPHLDCSGFRVLLYFSDISSQQSSASAEMDIQSSTDDPGVRQPYGGLSQQYLVKTKLYDSGKNRRHPQDNRSLAVSSH